MALFTSAAPLFIAMVFSVAEAQSTDCPAPTDNMGIEKFLRAAEDSLSDADFDGFQAATQQAALAVPCMGEQISKAHAAHLHQLHGIRLFVTEDPTAAATAFLAARVLDRNAAVPSVFPEGHDIYNVFNQLDAKAPESTRIIAPKKGALVFDGTESRDRPSDRPTLVQVLGSDDAILSTTYAMPADALPDYATPKLAPLYSPGKKYRLLQSSLVSGIGSAILYGLAQQNKNAFETYELTNTGNDQKNLESLMTKSWVLVGGSTALLGVSTSTAIASYRTQ